MGWAERGSAEARCNRHDTAGSIVGLPVKGPQAHHPRRLAAACARCWQFGGSVVGNAQFVALEGPKGVGKTALCVALAARLHAHECDQVVITKEPTPAFDLRNEQNLRGIDLAKAVTADRRAHVAAVIAPALAASRPVVCDRYVLSSHVFHANDGVAVSTVTELNCLFPVPSLNLLLGASPEEIHHRRALRGAATRLQEPDSAYEFAQYIRYAKLMERLGTPYRICDNSNQEAQHAIVEWLVSLLCTDDWKRDEHRSTGHRR
jgi:dTMP kinase